MNDMIAPFNAISVPFEGCKIERGDNTIMLNETEQAKLLDTLLDSNNGLAFSMDIEHSEQIAVLACDNGRFNLVLRSICTMKRRAVIGISSSALTGLAKSIEDAKGGRFDD